MINLFLQFDADSIAIYNSQQVAGLKIPTIVIFDDGFLPQDIMTPYKFFAGIGHKRVHGRYFNALDIPEYYEIRGDNQQAKVIHMTQEIAHIHYRRDYKRRIIERVDFLDDNQQVMMTEYYNQYGDKFKEVNYNETGLAIFERFFDEAGREIIYINHRTQSISLRHNGKERMFSSMEDFLSYYFECAKIDTSQFIINRLSLPLFTVLKQGEGRDILYWQEDTEYVPENMRYVLEDVKHRKFKVVVPKKATYNLLVQQLPGKNIIQTGYLYRYMRNWTNTRNVAILTNSDSIAHLEAIITASPDYTFHIMAITEMSGKLKALMKYHNVHLYPNASIEAIRDVYQQCSIYLDINDGNEIMNAVRSAFDYQQVILGYKEIAHNQTFTHPDCLFAKADYNHLIERLNQLKTDQAIEQAVLAQRSAAGEAELETFVSVYQ